MIPCPYCEDREFSTLYGLKRHVNSEHTEVCPVCNEKYRNIKKHAYEMAYWDRDHMILYGLLGRKHQKLNELHKECRDMVYELFCGEVCGE
ncbi:hypothetical protein [Geoglobus acetivorans]|uniref:C2H2-type domain-containing protein n=1 Tax=Geoglobus acetivorans TaxID=565033 RepID=A0ABZ3H226_GEOAI|nr:hypothetical protein [Geoglobus acetivorans]